MDGIVLGVVKSREQISCLGDKVERNAEDKQAEFLTLGAQTSDWARCVGISVDKSLPGEFVGGVCSRKRMLPLERKEGASSE
jgi:hypothetical protein